MDVNRLRKDFPILERKFGGKSIVYFDNSCATLRPKRVVEAIEDYYYNFPACGGRSIHKLGTEVTIRMEEAREAVGRFVNAPSANGVVFLKNTTEAINLVASGLGLKKGDVVMGSDKEHNSNLVPWQILALKRGITHITVPSKEDNTFDLDAYGKAFRGRKVKLVSVVHTSNLDGVTNPAKDIVKVAHEHGALVLLDGAQSAPHRRIDLKDLDADFFAFSMHKMCGPSGVGVLAGKYEHMEELEPLIVGGHTVTSTTYKEHNLLKPPQRFEAGLQDYAGMIASGTAVKYLSDIGMDSIQKHEHRLNALCTDLLDVDGISLIGPRDPGLRGGIFSFNVRNTDPHDVALILDETRNIMIRSGAHCVHSWFGPKGMKGSARATFYLYNTEEEVRIFAEEVRRILNTFKG